MRNRKRALVIALVAFAVVATAAFGATGGFARMKRRFDDKVVDERWHGKGLGGMENVPWNDVETDFQRLAQPNTLTFVELSGSHCGGCVKNAKRFKELLRVRHDISVRIVQFPDELCPEHPDAEQRKNCQAVVEETKRDGMCFTPTLWAIAPDGTLLARDDTCKDEHEASVIFHHLADKELARAL
ncbi:MAG TPA: hypothetical protein VGO62_09200 [Myxococcota bacterium]|jgi:hypothetical protein